MVRVRRGSLGSVRKDRQQIEIYRLKVGCGGQ